MGDLLLITDESDELKVFNAASLMSATIKDIAPPPPGLLAHSPTGDISKTQNTIDNSLLGKMKIYRSPAPGASTPNLLLEYDDILKIAFCCSSQVRECCIC